MEQAAQDVCVCRGVTGYLKKLKEFLNSPAGKKGEEEDVKIKQIALRSTENLQVTSWFLFLELTKICQS
jgi:hypothetical protein